MKNIFVTATSPGIVYKDLLIIGTRVTRVHRHTRHFVLMIFVTVNRNGSFIQYPSQGKRYDSWEDPEAYKAIGGANAWGGLSLDNKRGIAFAGTGSANYDFFGGMRKGNNLFANSVLALDAGTGKYIWHFQYIHHDVWDRDLPAPPVLVTVSKEGRKIDAVAVTTKTGYVFVFERETGKPVYDIIEKPVPTDSDLTGNN